MKHEIKVTLLLVLIFLIAQFVGLFIVKQYLVYETIDGVDVIVEDQAKELPFGMERPDVGPEYLWLYIVGAIVVGTLILLGIIKSGKRWIWKLWYFMALVSCMSFALFPFIGAIPALISGILLASWKIYKPNFFIHNMTEIFIYGGLAAIFSPIATVKVAFIILGIISLYDMFAVWQSKHMVKLANFQTESRVFAGLMIPYDAGSGTIDLTEKPWKASPQKVSESKKDKLSKKTKLNHNNKLEKDLKKLHKISEMNHSVSKKNAGVSNAILGGGDIGFPLMFAGTIMKYYSFGEAAIVSIFAAFSLLVLLMYSKKGRFYPAMPFLSMGCLVGYLVIYFF